MLPPLPRALLIIASWFCAALVSAEQMRTFDNFDIHYSVVNTTFLKPAIAAAYGITRAEDRAIINIAVRERIDDGSSRARKAVVSGATSNLVQSTALEFHEVTEQDAIYYIATFHFDHDEVRNFTVRIQPDVNRPAYELKFSQRLYRD